MTYRAEDLAGHPAILATIQMLAGQLRDQYDGNPRLSRYMVSHQRWLLSQAAFALYLEYETGVSEEGLTTSRMKELIASIGAASRNTVLNFLDQVLIYKFMRIAGDPLRRPRRFEATEVTIDAMMRYLGANLAALDALDNGDRLSLYAATPRIFQLMQPRVARHCIGSASWRSPPPRIGMFQWTESGGLVMDELIRRVDPAAQNEDRIDIGRIDARVLAENFMMSRTHLQRLFKKAVDAGSLEWHDTNKKTHMYMKSDFLREYILWQSEKFAIISEAYDWALSQLEGASV